MNRLIAVVLLASGIAAAQVQTINPGDTVDYRVLNSNFSLLWNKPGQTGPAGPTGSGYGATSLSLVTVSTGLHLFTLISSTGAPLAYAIGSYVGVYSASNTANFMEGTVTAWDGTNMSLNVTRAGGSGQHADWQVSLAGPSGLQALAAGKPDGAYCVVISGGVPTLTQSGCPGSGGGTAFFDSATGLFESATGLFDAH